MRIKFIIIILVFSLAACSTKYSDMEICYGNIRDRIKSDSIIIKIKYCNLDSYRDFIPIITKAVNEEAKSNSICSTAINNFFLENKENSITVNNLLLFQQFQAFLRHEKFNQLRAKKLALEYEAKLK